MSLYWFPDNTVLCNFAAAAKLSLLEDVLRGRGRWVEAIEAEASASARFYPDLADIVRSGWLGDPIEITDIAEVEQIERVRRAVFGGSLWITNDCDAQEYARAQGIMTRDTMDLVSEAVVDGCCSRDEGFKMLHQMVQFGRYLRIPQHPSHL